jgi:putative transcriptional regulator
MIHHHPDDEFLLSLAAGHLRAGEALVVSAHLDACAACRVRMHTLQALGGRLLAETEPVALAAHAWERTLEKIDRASAEPVAARVTPATTRRPSLPLHANWPASLCCARVGNWRFAGPGRRWARVQLPQDPGANLFLLRIDAGKSLPRHTHGGMELSQIICGALEDGRAVFGPGDFDFADEDVHHQPVVKPGATCVCLVYVGARMKFDTVIASLMGSWVGV